MNYNTPCRICGTYAKQSNRIVYCSAECERMAKTIRARVAQSDGFANLMTLLLERGVRGARLDDQQYRDELLSMGWVEPSPIDNHYVCLTPLGVYGYINFIDAAQEKSA